MDQRTIRPERSQEQYSRGLELIKAIQRMWDVNDMLRQGVTYGEVGTNNEIINRRIRAIMSEFDLTVYEWHYWADIAGEAEQAQQYRRT